MTPFHHQPAASARALLIFMAHLAWAAVPASAATPASSGSARVVLPSDVIPLHYAISVDPDAQAMTFKGAVDIDVDVRRPTRRIALNSADLAIDAAALADGAAAAHVAVDEEHQVLRLDFAQTVPAGHHTLHIDYHGRIAESAAGLFALAYATPQGPAKALFTQFENSDARRFVPCWDEPGRKATFDLSAVVPAGQMALSNMPIAQTHALSDGRQQVRFMTTPKMSTYLLYFGSGDFERAHRLVDGVDVGVVVRRGELANAEFALDAAARILPWYNDYFGFAYPLPKLDMVAGPGSSQFFGAMENWGAIFYFEPALLIDPRTATSHDRQEVFSTIAHEMAHQWFGDLVTMAWWDDLWLNEGFASWMEAKASDHFHPEWQRWLQSQEGAQSAMAVDARAGTHPVITPIADVLQAAGSFDTITYQKGQSVIRTLEAYVGEDAFRDGVRRYMRRHAYGNTVTDDLWREMDRGAARPIAGLAHDLTRQAGVPLLDVLGTRCVDGHTTVRLSQGHFAVDASATSARTWRVPVALALPGGPTTRVLVRGAAPRDVTLAGCGPVLVNAGQAGYLRVRYDAASLAALSDRFEALPAADQLGLLDDARSLGLAGQVPMARLLVLLRTTGPDADPFVESAVVDRLHTIAALAEGLPLQATWRAFALTRLAPLRTRVGWTGVDGERAAETQLRANVLAALADFGDGQVLAEARQRFERLRLDADALDAETRHTVLAIVAAHADAATWDALRALARSARTENERDEAYTLLASSRSAVLAQRALDLALSDEPPTTTKAQMVSTVAALHPGLAVDFAVAHWAVIEPLIEPDSRGQFVPQLAASGWDDALLATLARFGVDHIPASAWQDLRKSEAEIRERARMRQARLPEVARWLAQPARHG
jgi:aminopeptidase N